MNTDQDTVGTAILSGKIITGAMIVGVAVFGVVVLVLGDRMVSQPSLGWVLVGVVASVAFAFSIFYLFFRATVVRAARASRERSGEAREPTRALAQTYNTLVLIRAGLVEAVGLVGLVSLLITGQKLLWAAPAIAIVLLAAGLPSRSRFDAFVQEVTGSNPYSS
jgi:hypothetical protein